MGHPGLTSRCWWGGEGWVKNDVLGGGVLQDNDIWIDPRWGFFFVEKRPKNKVYKKFLEEKKSFFFKDDGGSGKGGGPKDECRSYLNSRHPFREHQYDLETLQFSIQQLLSEYIAAD